MSRKSERLVNLTIALLATKRYLTKSEIFRSIEGYDGSDESKERMFERDKDDLRSLGIEIEVGGLDPLFNDEAGYRIKPENYALDLGELTGVDIALLSLAAQAWNGQALDSAAHSALVKLHSIGIDSALDSIPTMTPRMSWSDTELATVIDAIASRTPICFSYADSDLVEQARELQTYAVASRDGFWYFAGFDSSKKAVRTFRFDRVVTEIETKGKSGSYEIPQDFQMFAQSQEMEISLQAILDVRKGKAFTLRKKALYVQDMGEWDRVTLAFNDEISFVDSILWHLDDVFVIEPQSLRAKVIAALDSLVKIHE